MDMMDAPSFDGCSAFINEVRNSLETHNIQHVLTLFNNNQYYENMKSSSWDLIPIITKYLTSQYEVNHINVFKGCEVLIDKLAENANPEETLLQFIEEIELATDNTRFVTLLLPMLKTLQRIPKNRLNSVGWCLNAIQSFLNKVGGEVELTTTSDLKQIEMLYCEVMHFYSLLIPFYSRNASTEFRIMLSKHLIELLGSPLHYLDLKLMVNTSNFKKILKDIIINILTLMENPFCHFEIEKNEYLVPNSLAYGEFLYLILHEKIGFHLIPKVFNTPYIFCSSLNTIVDTLKTDNRIIIEKGLNLSNTLLERNLNLSYHFLDLDVNKEFCSTLETIIVFNEIESIRKEAFNVFELYIDGFEIKGKYLLLYNLVNYLNHDGLLGFIITKYKDTLYSLKKSDNVDKGYFESEKLYSFTLACCKISKSDQMNVIDATHKIMSTLNLMRFVILQETPENMEVFKGIVEIWRLKYFEYLSKILKETKEDLIHKKHDLGNSICRKQNVSVTVKGESIQKSEIEEMRDIDLSFTSFEVMESLLNRLIELLKERKCLSENQ